MRRLGVLVSGAVLFAACGTAGQGPASTESAVNGSATTAATTTTEPATTTRTTATAATRTTATTAESPPTAEATGPSLVVATEEGVFLWSDGNTQVLVDGASTRVAFQFGDGAVVYQESRHGYHDEDQAPVMIREEGADSRVVIGTDRTSPVLWGVGEIEGSPVAIYERWPVPCGGGESEPECIGPLMAFDLRDGSERDLGAFSAPGYALGPSGAEGGIALTYNSGAEIGDIGTFRLAEVDGDPIDNPVCLNAVDCSQPLRMIGALSRDAERIAYVLDQMTESDEFEYETVGRSFGIVQRNTGEILLTVELEQPGRLAWLDFNGEDGLVSVSHEDAVLTYLIDADGRVTPINLGGITTFTRSR